MTDGPEPTTTTLTRRWKRKFIIFLIVSVGFGIYGLVDATIVYPNRGERDAEYRLFRYLEASDQAHSLTLPLGVPDGQTPQSRLDDLRSEQADLTQRAGGEGGAARDAAAQLAKLAWFESLGKVWQLTPERIDADLSGSPRETLSGLRAEWENRDNPKPLAWFDIPVQWLFTVVGFGLGIWLAFHMYRVASKSYTWDPAELRLGLPGGASIVPGDVVDFDKRKWDKFLFFFKINADHPQLGGREIKLDLYQYDPLEDWAVAMHKHARPEDYEDENEDEGGDDSAAEAAPSESEEAAPVAGEDRPPA
ncbi:MAG: hypothetical protein AAFR96_01505 [Planctomycetota bacterium]